MTAAQTVALILFALAAILTAVSWLTPLDTRVPLLLACLGGCFLVLDVSGEVFD
jgi:hypothetical protein